MVLEVGVWYGVCGMWYVVWGIIPNELSIV